MIDLYGVVHGGQAREFFGPTHEIDLEPTRELRSRLLDYPGGTRVGVEWFRNGEWEEIEADLVRKCRDKGLSTSGYNKGVYWKNLISFCESVGYEVVTLETRDVWIKYNDAMVRLGEINRGYDDLCLEEGETDRDYRKKLIGLNEKSWKVKVESNRVHLVERDELILGNISSNNLQVVISGLGHTDYWMLNQARLKESQRVEFGMYCTDSVLDPPMLTLHFTENAVPNPHLAYDFSSVKRSVHLMEQGRLFPEIPDWAGIWDVAQPSRGYFEVFIDEQNNGKCKGRIEDLLGTAEFDGEINPRFLRFVKRYGDSNETAVRSEISYETEESPNDRESFYGIFRGENAGGYFYMERFSGSSPFGMSMSWYDLKQDIEGGQQRLF